MGGIFNIDGKFFSVMTKIADLIILNILWIICCIPIITIGASTTALHYVTLKMVKDEEAYIFKSFFRSFKQNFRQSSVIWVFLLFGYVVAFLDLIILRDLTFPFSNIVHYVILALLLILTFVTIYIFPIQAKFFNKIKNTFKNAFLISIRHLPSTVAMVIILIGPFVISYFVRVIDQYIILFYILIGFSGTAYANSFFFNKIFENYLPKDDDENVDTIEDENI
jgi:Predicted integral membrane protein